MANTASGISSQLGFAEESTNGTFETPTSFIEFLSESLKLEIERIESAGIRAGRRVLHRWSPGVQRVTGDFEIELVPHGIGYLLKNLMGNVGTTGAGPYTHTITLGDLGDTLTLQVNRPSIDATNRVFSYLGCHITEASFSMAVNEYAKATFSVYGQDEDTAQSLATASYPATYTPFVWSHGSITVAGSGVDVKSVDLNINRNLVTDRHFIRSSNPALPKISKEGGLTEITGTLVTDFEDLTAYTRFVNGSEAALVVALDAGAGGDTLTFTMNVRFDGETPEVGGPDDLLEQSLPFKAVHSTADNSAISIALVNNESSLA